MKLPVDRLGPGETHQHEASGPGGQRVLVAECAVTLSADSEPVIVRVAVAEDLARVSAATTAFARDFVIALVLLCCVLAPCDLGPDRRRLASADRAAPRRGRYQSRA